MANRRWESNLCIGKSTSAKSIFLDSRLRGNDSWGFGCDKSVFSLIGLSGFRPRIGVRGKLFAGMTGEFAVSQQFMVYSKQIGMSKSTHSGKSLLDSRLRGNDGGGFRAFSRSQNSYCFRSWAR